MNSPGLGDVEITTVFVQMAQDPEFRDSDELQEAVIYLLENAARLHSGNLRSFLLMVLRSRRVDCFRQFQADARTRQALEIQGKHLLIAGSWKGVGDIRRPSSVLDDLISCESANPA